MVKKTVLLLVSIAFSIGAPCHAMQMAAQAAQSMQTQDETAAKELIKQLLGKKYSDMVSELDRLSKENKEFINHILHKNYLLFAPQVQQQNVLTGHSAPITAATFSCDGQFALTGSMDNTARLWDLTKSPITSQELTGHTSFVTSVAFSPNRRFALTGSEDHTARLLQLAILEIDYHCKTVSKQLL